jgi:Xaa-Pro aminopeptidase
MTTQTAPAPLATTTTPQERLEALRSRMSTLGVDALLVRATDRYLNEYVPPWSATREWLSGFTGSTGDALVTLTQAYLFVDGRYHLQAEQEVTPAWSVVKLTQAEPIFTGMTRMLEKLLKDKQVTHVGVESDRTSMHERDTLDRLLAGSSAQLHLLHKSPIEALMERVPRRKSDLRVLDEERVGVTSARKVAVLQEALQKADVDVMIVQKLDDLAYLTNLRAEDLPYQATFTGMGAVGRHGAVVCLHDRPTPAELVAARPAFRLVDEAGFMDAVKKVAGGTRAGVDGGVTTESVRQALLKAGFTLSVVPSPLTDMKARKTPEELERMTEAFRQADLVVSRCVGWLNRKVSRGDEVTEADFAKHVERTFLRSGATGLSFKVISAAGANGAIIHYSTPDPKRVIREGELMLLDTGAYYGEGYATDLTRTFLVGGPKVKATDEQKRVFTLVLRSAIAGMTAVLPVGAPGVSLDAITRKPLWDHFLTYNHGTGHGVGINVHEAPPSINMRSMLQVGAGHVFSIEPGVYVAGWGGVRIENLCTAVEDAEHPGWLRIKPLTFSPLDARLIDPKLLTAPEKEFLKWFREQARAAADEASE